MRLPAALFEGRMVVCIASGPSLTPEQCEAVRGRAGTIAVNDAVYLAPWADIHYACDARWWAWHWQSLPPEFSGIRIGLEPKCPRTGAVAPDEVMLLSKGGTRGYDPRPGHITTGGNSGYQAVHLAADLGASRILLLGYDHRDVARHFFGRHPAEVAAQSGPASWIEAFRHLWRDLDRRGVEIVNCTPGSGLDFLPMTDIDDALDLYCPAARAAS